LALALILLVGSGLLVRSFIALSTVNIGFDPGHVLSAKVTLPDSKYSSPAKRQAFFQQLLDRLKGLPGVRYPSLAGSNGTSAVRIEGEPHPPPGAAPSAVNPSVSADYFRALRIPLLAGRFLDESDGTRGDLPLIVNQSFARRFFPAENAIGKRIKLGAPTAPWHSIVGLVGDVRQLGPSQDAEAAAYVPYQQDTRASMTIFIRTVPDPLSFAAAVREQVQLVDPAQPAYDVASMEHILSDTMAAPRFNTLLLGIFAVLAVMLAVVGIYGVIASFVSQRTHEVGIRIALGATPRDILRLVLGQGIAMTGIGLALGILGSLALSRYLSALLFTIRPTDPPTILGAALILGGVSLLASYIPARRAMNTDPMVAIRYE
jgi:putative ABC transport system permease protein